MIDPREEKEEGIEGEKERGKKEGKGRELKKPVRKISKQFSKNKAEAVKDNF